MGSRFERLGELDGIVLPGSGPSFLLAEVRATLSGVGPAPDRVDVDGGCRVEFGDGAGERGPRDARFAVGAGPSAIPDLVAGRAPRAIAANEWTLAVEDLVAALEERRRELAREVRGLVDVLGRVGAEVDAVRLEVSGRTRAWRRHGRSGTGLDECGARLRCRARRGSEVELLDWLLGPSGPAPWSEDRASVENAIAFRLDRRAELDRAADSGAARGWNGPVVLLEPAAAWFAHELAHASAEWPALRAAMPPGLRLTEDPPDVGWPCGSTVDDAGEPTSAKSFGDGGSGPVLSRRRASVRDPAVPFLSCTRLTLPPAEDLDHRLPAGVPVIERVASARFDPVEGTVLLVGDGFREWTGTGWRRFSGVITALVSPVEALATARAAAPFFGATLSFATCARQGHAMPVAVGAPTLILDSVRVVAETPLAAAGFVDLDPRDQGHDGTAGEGQAAAPDPSEDPRHDPGEPLPALRLVERSSVLAEAVAGPEGTSTSFGCERGRIETEPAAASIPATPAAFAIAAAVEEHAARLREELVGAIGEPARVHLAIAQVRDVFEADGPRGDVRRIVAFARALAGGAAFTPRWSRTAVIDGISPAWPAGFLDAAARECRSWTTTAVPFGRSPALVLDVFAAADLLRDAAASWLSLPTGSRVTAAAVSIDDPGFAFPAAGGDVDAEGRPARAVNVVRGGVLVGLPLPGSDLASAGSAVSPSWRVPPRPDWRSLRLEAPELAWPGRADVVTRVQRIGGAWFAAGHVRHEGRFAGRFAWTAIPGPDWWLAHVRGRCSPAVADGGGLPVTVPALVLDRDPMAPAGHAW